MQKIHAQFALCLCLTAFLFSCSKTENNVSTVATYSSMEEVFGQLSLQPKVLTVDAATGGSFIGNSGTRYIFYPNSFQTSSGVSVTGNVRIEVTEYLDKGDMLFSKMLPISNGEPLISGGEINVVATQGGQSVYLKPYYVFQSNIPQGGTPPTGMSFFSGQPTVDTATIKTNWIQPAKDSTGYNRGFVTAMEGDTLGIISDTMKYCNADRFLDQPNYQDFTVTTSVIGASFSSSNRIYGYVLYDNYKGVWPLGVNTVTNGVFTEHHIPNIPVHFVVFTLINGVFYGGILGATPTDGNNYTFSLIQNDPTLFKNQLNKL